MMPHRPQSVQSRLGDRAESEGQTTKMGKVYLVGAGPGDPGLITIRGAECLAQADLVLYDGLANPKLLQLAPRAEHRSVGKHGDSPLWTQGEINAALVAAATAGQCVVRLKGGDPAVFARTAEELDALVEAGVPFEVVPGITAALAAASYVGIPITHRDHASAVAFITGQQQTDGAQDLDWPALAKFPGTLVFYMGVTTAGLWSQRLIEAGKSADTPAAIVRRCSWSDQQVIRCPLGRVAEHLTPASKLRPPVIVIIGEVARLGEAFDWFASRPLHRTGIWLTRPTSQNQQLERQLSDLGADVFVQPAIEICPTLDQAGMDAALERLAGGDFAGVAFTSKHAVDAVCDRLWELGYDQRVFAGVQLASVGDKTSQVLAARGLRADWVPAGHFNAERLLEVLASRASVAGQAWLLPQADRAREILAEGLLKLGAAVEAVEVYRALPPHQLRSDIVAALEKGLVQWVTVTSSQAARTLHELCQPYLRQLRPLSLSPAISQVLKELGWPAAAEARQATEESMVEALLEATAKSSA